MFEVSSPVHVSVRNSWMTLRVLIRMLFRSVSPIGVLVGPTVLALWKGDPCGAFQAPSLHQVLAFHLVMV